MISLEISKALLQVSLRPLFWLLRNFSTFKSMDLLISLESVLLLVQYPQTESMPSTFPLPIAATTLSFQPRSTAIHLCIEPGRGAQLVPKQTMHSLQAIAHIRMCTHSHTEYIVEQKGSVERQQFLGTVACARALTLRTRCYCAHYHVRL